MKITFGELTLAGPDCSLLWQDAVCAAAGGVRAEAYVDGTGPKLVRDPNSETFSLTFGVTRQHASGLAAFVYLASHARAVLAAGVDVLTLNPEAAGNNPAPVSFPFAHGSVRVSQAGLSTTAQYTFTASNGPS